MFNNVSKNNSNNVSIKINNNNPKAHVEAKSGAPTASIKAHTLPNETRSNNGIRYKNKNSANTKQDITNKNSKNLNKFEKKNG